MSDMLGELTIILTQIAEGAGDPKVLAKKGLSVIASRHTDGSSTFTIARRGADVEYTVEETSVGETLTERRRTGSAKPFRCPKPIYSALVQVLATTERPLPLDELIEAVAKVLGDQPPDFQVRVPLRLWLHVMPPLLVRNRARYRPAETKTFDAKANDLWKSLRN